MAFFVFLGKSLHLSSCYLFCFLKNLIGSAALWKLCDLAENWVYLTWLSFQEALLPLQQSQINHFKTAQVSFPMLLIPWRILCSIFYLYFCGTDKLQKNFFTLEWIFHPFIFKNVHHYALHKAKICANQHPSPYLGLNKMSSIILSFMQNSFLHKIRPGLLLCRE